MPGFRLLQNPVQLSRAGRQLRASRGSRAEILPVPSEAVPPFIPLIRPELMWSPQ